jgi:universal stress protein family protein
MSGRRIAVGFDGSVTSRAALAWALRTAARRRLNVLVVRAQVPVAGPTGSGVAGEAEWARLGEQVGEVVREAFGEPADHAGSDPTRPAVALELVRADPVTSLCRASQVAESVVVGDGRHVPHRLARLLMHRPRRYGGPCPLVVVATVPSRPAVVMRCAPRIPARRAVSGGRP